MRWGLVGFGSNGPDPKRATFNARMENLTAARSGSVLSTNIAAYSNLGILRMGAT